MTARFVFVCAAGHSGSTLLDRMLGAHPAGISLGEITQLPKNIALNSVCSCGDALASCRYWRDLITDFGASIEVDLWKDPYALDLGFIKAGREIDTKHQTPLRMLGRKLAYGLEYAGLRWRIPLPAALDRRLQQGTRNKLKLFRFMLDRADRQFVVDSSKHYLGALGLYRAAPEETRVIHLVRDGRAVFNSGLRRGMRPNAALDAWIRHGERASLLLPRYLPDAALLTIRYEDLAGSPDVTLRRITDFLGIEFDPGMLDFAASETHIANGNRMRFVNDSTIRLDERWRRELTGAMRQFFERRGGTLNRRLGYSADRQGD